MKYSIWIILTIIVIGGLVYVGVRANKNYTNSNTNTAQSSSVSVSNFTFAPATLTVVPNTTVTFNNNDSVAHTVTGTGFDSGSIASGGSYQHTFTQAGTYNYHCTIHPSMQGTIIVQ